MSVLTSTRPLSFTKMQGIGNDFVVVDCLAPGFDWTQDQLQAASEHLCDRKFGIGGDGVLLILPGDQTDFTMRMFNPDGTEAEMCGNGIRCFAKFVHDRGYSDKSVIRVNTGGGVKTLELTGGDASPGDRVKVDMGKPGLHRADLPMTGDPNDTAQNVPVEVGGQTVYLTCVSMGNPHAVFFTENATDDLINTLGPLIENHPLFPRRINVHAVQVGENDEVTMLTWERGAGRTLACGTGACAVAVASALNNKTGRRVLAHLPGGDLLIEWENDGPVYMTGAATEVFTGTIRL